YLFLTNISHFSLLKSILGHKSGSWSTTTPQLSKVEKNSSLNLAREASVESKQKCVGFCGDLINTVLMHPTVLIQYGIATKKGGRPGIDEFPSCAYRPLVLMEIQCLSDQKGDSPGLGFISVLMDPSPIRLLQTAAWCSHSLQLLSSLLFLYFQHVAQVPAEHSSSSPKLAACK
ncbi:hypothetical protein STEG23_006759, partial [Scotinomys teguina]